MKIKSDKVGNPGYYFEDKEKSEIIQALYERVAICRESIEDIERSIEVGYRSSQQRLLESLRASREMCSRLALEMED